MEGNICKSYTDKGFIFRIAKELLQFHNKKTTKLKMGKGLE